MASGDDAGSGDDGMAAPPAKKATWTRTTLSSAQTTWWAGRLAQDYQSWKTAGKDERVRIVRDALAAAKADAGIGEETSGWAEAQANHKYKNYGKKT